MLQQILRDMWVDPEILAELDDAQKQTLFCKMREEQVRRWRIWDQKISKEEHEKPKIHKTSKKKQVQFLKGEDGEPWVWVMGEHPDDKSIEAMLAEETQKRAMEQSREETHQLMKTVEKELSQLIEYKPLEALDQKFDLSPKRVESLEDSLDIYCTVDELRKRIAAFEPEVESPEKMADNLTENIKLDLNKNKLHFSFIEGKRDVFQEVEAAAMRSGDGVTSRVAQWERRVAASRLQLLRGLACALAHSQHREQTAREAETVSKIGRAADGEDRRSAHVLLDTMTAKCPARAARPPNKEAVIEWFITQELKRGVGLDENNKPVSWFHGLISRTEAEDILSSEPSGSFLVRISERVWGYVVSYRDAACCKHFLVDTHHPPHRLAHALTGYRLLGATQRHHHSLGDLVKFHETAPLTESGGEVLRTPCPPARPPPLLRPALSSLH